MSDLAEKLDLSRHVPQNYPGLMAYKYVKGCPKNKRQRQCPVPCYTKEFFCAEWGQNFKCLCPPQRQRIYTSPYTSIKEELASLDYFTRLPDNPNRKYPYLQYPASLQHKTMSQRYGLEDIDDCPKSGPGWSRICNENQKKFTLLHKDSVCGVCVPPEKAQPLQREAPYECEEQCQSTPEDMFDLPFCVKVGSWPRQNDEDDPYEKAFPRSGASRCIRPSTFHDLQSVHRENFRDFFKLKTEKELKYYRSPLAIDTRRPPLVLPSDRERDLVVSGPLCVNAVPLVMRPKGGQKFPKNLGPNFQVIVQGPICI